MLTVSFPGDAEGVRILETVFMQINTMGMLQDIRFKTEGNLNADLTFSSFRFELRSPEFLPLRPAEARTGRC